VASALEACLGDAGARLESATAGLSEAAAALSSAAERLGPQVAALGPELAALSREVALLAARTERADEPLITDEIVRLGEGMERLEALLRLGGVERA
jgi:hypothetical protein